ncbi:MAG: acetate kinase [Ornithinimicrobium sp.]
MADTVLVINAGSSSLKYQLIDPVTGDALAAGLVERIGEDGSSARHDTGGERFTTNFDCPDHEAAFDQVREQFAAYGPDLASSGVAAVGHRVVHGGDRFSGPARIDEEAIAAIKELAALAPLHNPANAQGIEAARQSFPGVPHVAVFDTAFHATMPAAASEYAVPRQWRREYGVRKYGFHGTSHAYVSRRVAAMLSRPVEEVNSIVIHLGNGASACAVAGGRSVDTSMGLSPTDGLVMGTRTGDLDPAVAGHLADVAGMSAAEFTHAINKESGLLGLTGSSDFREVMELIDAGDESATVAYEVVVHRIVRHVGALAAPLGRLDAVAFTAGVGENNAPLRADVLQNLSIFGLAVDQDRNSAASGEARISPDGVVPAAFVIPTNEEYEIAHQSVELLGRAGGSEAATT